MITKLRYFLNIHVIVLLQLFFININVVKADFVSINPLIKHIISEHDGSSGVIILPTGNVTKEEGIFLYWSKEIIPAQGFSLDKIPKESESAFIRYNSEANKFYSIITGDGKEYKIIGNFSLKLGNLKVLIHHESNFEPYVMIVFKDRSAVMLTALQFIYSSNNQELIKTMTPSIGTSYDEFTVRNSELTLGENNYFHDKIGLGVGGGTNPCASNSVSVLDPRQIDFNRLNLAKLEFFKSKNNFYLKNTILFSKQEYVIVQDGYGQIMMVKPNKSRLSDGSLVCIASVIDG